MFVDWWRWADFYFVAVVVVCIGWWSGVELVELEDVCYFQWICRWFFSNKCRRRRRMRMRRHCILFRLVLAVTTLRSYILSVVAKAAYRRPEAAITSGLDHAGEFSIESLRHGICKGVSAPFFLLLLMLLLVFQVSLLWGVLLLDDAWLLLLLFSWWCSWAVQVIVVDAHLASPLRLL